MGERARRRRKERADEKARSPQGRLKATLREIDRQITEAIEEAEKS